MIYVPPQSRDREFIREKYLGENLTNVIIESGSCILSKSTSLTVLLYNRTTAGKMSPRTLSLIRTILLEIVVAGPLFPRSTQELGHPLFARTAKKFGESFTGSAEEF